MQKHHLLMRTMLKTLIIILCVSFLASCGKTPQFSSKKVAGSWKLEKLVAAGGNAEAPAGNENADPAKAAERNRNLKTAMVSAQKGDMGSMTGLVKDLKDNMEFRADNTASLSIHGKLINGTWKMNEKGNGVTFTSADNAGTYNISIAKVDNYTMLVDEPSSIGPFRFSYSKQIKK